MAESVNFVTKNLQRFIMEKGILPRKDAGSGLWMSFLVPTAIIIGECKYSTGSLKYRVAACVSCGLIAHTLLLAYQAINYRFWRNLSFLPSACISTGLLYFCTREGLLFSVGYGVLCIYAYDQMLLPIMKLCPKSFTYGEASVVTQAFVLFLMTSLIRTTSRTGDCMSVTTIILQVGMVCIMGVGALSYSYNLTSKPKEFYSLLAFTIIFILLPSLHYLIEQNPILWIIFLITESYQTMELFSYWLMCSAAGVAVLVWQGGKATTRTRKLFHILAVMVFAPGIHLQPCLLYLASGVTFALFITLDMVRVLRLPGVGDWLEKCYQVFGDEKEEGGVSVSALYLLTGCSAPLWIHPDPCNAPLLTLASGLLSLGVGDTAASLCGSLCGKNQWPGSTKTKEGTGACFLSQLFLVIALIHYGYVPGANLMRPTFAIAAVSLVEAKSDQIDNLSLPLLMYIFLL